MVEELIDPRETPLHPRYRTRVIGHDDAIQSFSKALSRGTPHHAWMITGPSGVGKATLAFELSRKLLNLSGPADKTRSMIEARSHPDLHILERGLTKTKPSKLRGEISVDDTRELIQFFSRTASFGGWRVGIVDAVDELNSESANALLKLVEEPPANAILFLLVHQPGRALRTLRSRCTKLPIDRLSDHDTMRIVGSLEIEAAAADLENAIKFANGSPGKALQLLQSNAAKVFSSFIDAMEKRNLGAEKRQTLLDRFGPRGPSPDQFALFGDLLVQWIGNQAILSTNSEMAESYAQISHKLRIAEGFNLDRRVALSQALQRVEDALKMV